MSIDTKAYKRPLPKELAALPGEMVTRDISNDKKIHPLDPPHIVSHLARKAMGEWIAKERKQNPIKVAEIVINGHMLQLRHAPERYAVIDQALIDLYRSSILVSRAKQLLAGKATVATLKLNHIWFDTSKSGSMLAIRPGAAPPDVDRPDFLKNLKLTIDVTDWPKAMCDLLTTAGLNAQELEDAVKLKAAEVTKPFKLEPFSAPNPYRNIETAS